jgi:hypothetical protein
MKLGSALLFAALGVVSSQTNVSVNVVHVSLLFLERWLVSHDESWGPSILRTIYSYGLCVLSMYSKTLSRKINQSIIVWKTIS